jgi:hypothetical protein
LTGFGVSSAMRMEIRSLGWVESESRHLAFGLVFVFQTRDKVRVTSYLTPLTQRGSMHQARIVRSMVTALCADVDHAKFARWGLPVGACFVCIYMLRFKTSMVLGSMRVGRSHPCSDHVVGEG